MSFSVLDLLFKSPCCLCKKQSGKKVCLHCSKQIAPIILPYCSFCGSPGENGPRSCSQCLGRAYSFKQARAYGLYEGNLKRLIHYMKFHGLKELGPILGDLMIQGYRNYPELKEAGMILPVPLSKERLKERGFNQSALLAKHLAQGIGRPFSSGILARAKNTAPLFSKNLRERDKELQEAFVIVDPQLIKGKEILLVDDIYTSGTTAHHCALALLKGEARSVTLYTLCKDLV